MTSLVLRSQMCSSLRRGAYRFKSSSVACRAITTGIPSRHVAQEVSVNHDMQASIISTMAGQGAAPWKSSTRKFDRRQAEKTFPPGQTGHIRELDTFTLPYAVTGSEADRILGRQLVDSWRREGILQVEFPPGLQVLSDAIKQSKDFFARPHEEKAACVDSQSFGGYIASGEEITDGIADYSEIFTVTKHLTQEDPRVKAKWPCHGPNPWPNRSYEKAINELMAYKGEVGEKLLKLTGLGLGLKDPDAFVKLAKDGWHHMRVLRFPPTHATNGKGKPGRGIGSHTDYGMLVIAAQDEIGGLFVRRPIQGEEYSNWKQSSAGAHEEDDEWTYVAPTENVLTVFPGDMMQFMTNSHLPSTPHKVALNTRDRYAFAYFHEPNFNALCRRLPEFATPEDASLEPVHYGAHFSNMFMRNYPDRVTARRMREEKRMELLEGMKEEHGFSF